MKVEVYGGIISDEEKLGYIDYIIKKVGNASEIQRIVIKLDGDFVDLEWHFAPVPFERIRRITGYLVGSLDRFNDGKRAEVADRVHHGYDEEYYSHDFSGLLE